MLKQTFKDLTHPPLQECLNPPTNSDIGLGHMTFFSQWNVSKDNIMLVSFRNQHLVYHVPFFSAKRPVMFHVPDWVCSVSLGLEWRQLGAKMHLTGSGPMIKAGK